MIVVTGAAGFIGSNIVKAFNDQGRYGILAVDDLTDGSKFKNLADCRIVDYMDKDEFINVVRMGAGLGGEVEAVFHQGACTDTAEWDGRYMMANNHEYSKSLLRYCLERQIPFIYASSAAVYGRGTCFEEAPDCEAPLNVYGYSKLVFDEYVRSMLPKARSQIVGLRYFNVYGPREQHKGRMASVAYHFNQQLLQDGRLRLFQGSDGYADGEQRRDFIYVGDVAAVNLWFLDRPEESGIYNVGTGRSQTFNELARAVIDYHGRGEIEYVPFPEHLRGRYQSFTEADIGELRAAGYGMQFRSLEEAVPEYLAWLSRDER